MIPPRASVRISVDFLKFCVEECPNLNCIMLDGYDLREAGASLIQEIVWPMVNAIEIADYAVSKGLDPDKFFTHFQIFLSVYNNFFEDIAKFRVVRKMWATILRDRYKVENSTALKLKFGTKTAGSTLTMEEPLNNIARVAIQTLAAALGGVQSQCATSYDEAICLPTEESVKVGIKTNRIVQFETGVTDIADPLAGSYYFEWLTDSMTKAAWAELDKIMSMGGYVACIENGYFEREKANNTYKFQREVDSGEEVIVGVNRFREEEKVVIPRFHYDEESARRLKERTRRMKMERDNEKVKQALAKMREAVESGRFITPTVIEAVKVYCTLGEITQILIDKYGEYKEVPILASKLS